MSGAKIGMHTFGSFTPLGDLLKKFDPDVLYPVYEETEGRDGYISLECSPYLANDTEGTAGEALRPWEAVARPNLMVKCRRRRPAFLPFAG